MSRGKRRKRNRAMNNQVQRAKRALKLPQLMRMLGVSPQFIPIKDGHVVKCLFHHDRKPSFNIYKDGTRAHCFACGFDLDGPGFVAKWNGTTNEQGCRDFIRLASGRHIQVARRPSSSRAILLSGKKAEMELPQLYDLDDRQVQQIAEQRNIDVCAVDCARRLGVLKFTSVCRYPSWVLLDNSGYIAEARRLDGQYYPQIGTLCERKAHTFKGATKSWPVGLGLIRQYPSVRAFMLVEGGPDYLAAFHLLLQFNVQGVMPIALLGKGAGSAHIHPEALRLLGMRHVRIYPHNDPDGGGRKAAQQWAQQIRSTGCTVDIFPFEGLGLTDNPPVKDLNEVTMLHPRFHEKLQILFQ